MYVLRCGKIASPPPPSPDEITAVEGEEQLCLAPEEGKVLLSTDSMMACLEVAVEHWHTMSRTVVQVCGCGLGCVLKKKKDVMNAMIVVSGYCMFSVSES